MPPKPSGKGVNKYFLNPRSRLARVSIFSHFKLVTLEKWVDICN